MSNAEPGTAPTLRYTVNAQLLTLNSQPALVLKV
jgi:hypothetical protein